MSHDHTAPPLNPLPWVVWALALPLIAMEVVLQLGEAGLVGGQYGIGWRIDAVTRFAFAPDYLRAAWDRGQWLPQDPHRLLSYVLVHGSFTNTLFAVVILLALGKMVGEIFRWWAVVAVYLGSALVGVVVYTLVLPGVGTPVIGAFPADYGLIGAFTFLLWMRLAGTGTNQFRAFSLIGMLLFIQMIFGVLFGGGYLWVAEVAGFAAGFLISFLVAPGGWARLVGKLRNR